MINENDFHPILRMGITVDEEIFIAKKISKILSEIQGKILDYACGNCLIPIYISITNNKEIYCIDDWKYVNRKEVEGLISKYTAKVKLFDGLDKIPFSDKYFDFIYSVMYFYNLKRDKLKETLNEVLRVLKDNGKILIVDMIMIRGKIKKEMEERKYSLDHYEEANGLFFSIWKKL
ncbi:class I SAM-dependent methyltransferase [Sulfolobus sp. S-194]|uniref:methyltransferase domain-containing protein n=1 Tax=Sulfolobus sp. S-194 TaxID=2512240 RepID=UPI001436FC18|nr:methyltransferase domain-containing protein [Sulfolobus sp. S-194]QIW24562.1 class I SAM-dependent methyltransferase [Sulfolobus sp. S-194]